MTSLHKAGDYRHSAGDNADAYERIYNSEEFRDLRNRFRRFVFPVTVGFLAWYLLYVLFAVFLKDFMSTQVVGNINVALIFGVLQFVSTFGIAWWYAKWAAREFDPKADELLRDFEKGTLR